MLYKWKRKQSFSQQSPLSLSLSLAFSYSHGRAFVSIQPVQLQHTLTLSWILPSPLSLFLPFTFFPRYIIYNNCPHPYGVQQQQQQRGWTLTQTHAYIYTNTCVEFTLTFNRSQLTLLFATKLVWLFWLNKFYDSIFFFFFTLYNKYKRVSYLFSRGTWHTISLTTTFFFPPSILCE